MDKKIIYEEIGHIYWYELRSQTFDETIKKLTETKLEYEKKGYFDFKMRFICGEDVSSIYLSSKRYESDEEVDKRLEKEEKYKQTVIEQQKQKEQEERKMLEELKEKYDG